jgi:hypothetical protein
VKLFIRKQHIWEYGNKLEVLPKMSAAARKRIGDAAWKTMGRPETKAKAGAVK